MFELKFMQKNPIKIVVLILAIFFVLDIFYQLFLEKSYYLQPTQQGIIYRINKRTGEIYIIFPSGMKKVEEIVPIKQKKKDYYSEEISPEKQNPLTFYPEKYRTPENKKPLLGLEKDYKGKLNFDELDKYAYGPPSKDSTKEDYSKYSLGLKTSQEHRNQENKGFAGWSIVLSISGVLVFLNILTWWIIIQKRKTHDLPLS